MNFRFTLNMCQYLPFVQFHEVFKPCTVYVKINRNTNIDVNVCIVKSQLLRCIDITHVITAISRLHRFNQHESNLPMFDQNTDQNKTFSCVIIVCRCVLYYVTRKYLRFQKPQALANTSHKKTHKSTSRNGVFTSVH